MTRFWNVEISLHFNLAFSQCSTGIYQAFDRQTGFSRIFNFAFFPTREIRENLLHTKKYVVYSVALLALEKIIVLFCREQTKWIFRTAQICVYTLQLSNIGPMRCGLKLLQKRYMCNSAMKLNTV